MWFAADVYAEETKKENKKMIVFFSFFSFNTRKYGHYSSGGHISRICQISALSGNILPFMSSLHFWHFCRKIHRFTLIGIFDNDSLLRALSKTEKKYFKTICFRYGTSQHIIRHRKIVVNNTNQSKSGNVRRSASGFQKNSPN